MIQPGVYTETQKDIVIEALLTAKHFVYIAVAWINFEEYRSVFDCLLTRGVDLKIIVNGDIKNLRHKDIINDLQTKRLEIKFFYTTNKNAYMHHKFCVIDNALCMMGSFNWTKNANENNFEDLTVVLDQDVINGYYKQFKVLWELSPNDFLLLRKPVCCETCNAPIVYICVLSQEGDNQTKADYYKTCGCGELQWVDNDFFDISVYNNLLSIIDTYADYNEKYFLSTGSEIDEKMLKNYNNDIANYLSNIRFNRMKCPIIHAVGIYGFRNYYKDPYNIIKIIWTEKYASQYVEKEYELE